MSHAWIQRIRLPETRLPTQLYAFGFQDGHARSVQKRRHLHSSSSKKACLTWSQRLRVKPVYRLSAAYSVSPVSCVSPGCCNLSLLVPPHSNHNIHTLWYISSKHSFHSSTCRCKENDATESPNKETEKIDKTVTKTSGEAKTKNGNPKGVVVKLTLRQKIARFHANASKVGYLRYLWNGLKGFLVHMRDGFKLFFIDLRISAPLLLKYIREGKSAMKRREYRQLTRTLADLIRMIPLIASVVIPFGEVAMPFLIAKGLMPKSFIQKDQQDGRDRLRLQKKLEYGALLSESLKHMSAKSDSKEGAASLKDFLAFLEKVKSTEVMPTNEEIVKFSRLFEDELTIDDLRVDQLQGLCKLLGIDFIAEIPSEKILRFQIDVALRQLMVDDKLIMKEGLDSLAIWELQQACRARGMRAVGVSEERLRLQLQQWLELHLKEKIPSSLLLLSRLIYLDENLSLTEALKNTISALPETTVDRVIVQSAETLGEEVEKKTKIKVLAGERKALKEQQKKEKEEQLAAVEAAALEAQAAKLEVDGAPLEGLKPEHVVDETLVDKAELLKDIAQPLIEVYEGQQDKAAAVEEPAAPVEEREEEITAQDLGDIEKAIEEMSRHQKDEIEDVKEDFADIAEEEKVEEEKEGVKSLLLKEQPVSDIKGATKLQKKLEAYLDDLSSTIDNLNVERAELQEKLEIAEVKLKHSDARDDKQVHQHTLQEVISDRKRNLVSINEVMLSLRRLQKLPDDVRMQKVLQVLDDDHDGMIDVNDVLKVTEALIRENLKMNKSQVARMMSLLRKEEELEEERRQQERTEKDDNGGKNGGGDGGGNGGAGGDGAGSGGNMDSAERTDRAAKLNSMGDEVKTNSQEDGVKVNGNGSRVRMNDKESTMNVNGVKLNGEDVEKLQPIAKVDTETFVEKPKEV